MAARFLPLPRQSDQKTRCGVFKKLCGAFLLCKSIAKIRNVPFPRPCGATGNDAQKLHAPAFAHFRGAVLTHEVLCPSRQALTERFVIPKRNMAGRNETEPWKEERKRNERRIHVFCDRNFFLLRAPVLRCGIPCLRVKDCRVAALLAMTEAVGFKFDLAL